MKLYKNISPVFVYIAEGTHVPGPIFIKTDRGADRQRKAKQSLKFRRDIHTMGVHISPGLPNSTVAT